VRLPRAPARIAGQGGILLVLGALALVLAGGVSAFSLWLGRSEALPSPRPFTPAGKRALIGELQAALALRLKYSYNRQMIEHARRAADLARAHGQRGLALEIDSAFASSCRVGGSEYHLRRALATARALPALPSASRPRSEDETPRRRAAA